MMRIFHVKVTINGEVLEYDTNSEEELMKDLKTYNQNNSPYSVSRRDVA